MSVENESPKFITIDSMPKGEPEEPKAESIPVQIEIPESIKIQVQHRMGENAMKHVFGDRVPVEPQPGREPIIIPMPPDPSHVIGWNGDVRH